MRLGGRIKHVEIYKSFIVLLMIERDSECIKAKAYCKRKMKEGRERRVKMREKIGKRDRRNRNKGGVASAREHMKKGSQHH